LKFKIHQSICTITITSYFVFATTFVLHQVVLASALFAAALARPDGPRYGAAPVYEELAPQPFAYQYGVADDYSKANFKKEETQDNYGKSEMLLPRHQNLQ
jgi:hypothetical protein